MVELANTLVRLERVSSFKSMLGGFLGLKKFMIKLTLSLGFLRKFKHLVSFMRELIIVGRVFD
jgi:hypothetical protein